MAEITENRKNNNKLIMFEDHFSYNNNYSIDTNFSMKDSQLLDAIDNKFIFPSRLSISPSRRLSVSPRQNGTFQLDTISEEEDDEPALLVELEIYPEKIKEKAITIINPFNINELEMESFLADIDLSGPAFFCFLFGACLFLAGKISIFSHIYSVSMISVIGMYGLLKSLCFDQKEHLISIRGVASALGYGMLHLVWLSFAGIFIQLNTFNGFMFASPAIFLSTFGASRILSNMSNQPNNGILIAYPTAMVYIMFAYLVVY